MNDEHASESVRKPIGGRRLGAEHKAMVDSGIDQGFRLAWLARQMDDIEADQRDASGGDARGGTDQ